MSYKQKFLDGALKHHGNTYDYSNVPDKITYKDIVTIRCPIHGTFEQKARTHCTGCGCPKCAQEQREINAYAVTRHTKNTFIQKAQLAHGDYYDYSDTVYLGQMKRLTIRCPVHGKFDVVANNHIHGSGCPRCKRSRGETLIANALDSHNITYVEQYTFDDLIMPDLKRNTQRPKFDFYLPTLDVLIEFDGKHHFEPVRFNGVSVDKAIELHNRIKETDAIKTQYAKLNNIDLLRIPYTEIKNIPNIIKLLA